ncbi:hypothetical protein HMPREF0367_00264 [[Eubacterium] cylindroides ATCC 27803]|uniref:Uncharacterized protein n=1 Tax=Faecalitalea cylindroides ATCC 27803 TaxID=649755 RepID=U2PS91_9FIRM|nr:hypothetical protein HMPREF0367_00264 [[Eubacterium] cylindroides ATCC 27803] [Faecalitalea cylindroides ATCC 27803]
MYEIDDSIGYDQICPNLSVYMCAGHGTNSVGDKLTTGSYHQV